MTVDYTGAMDMLLPDYYSFSSVSPLSIVVHKTGGDATVQAVHNTFLQTMRSTHFAIGLDGTVAQYVPLARGAGGNCCADSTHESYWDAYIQQFKNLNFCTISIEHCDPTSTNMYPMPQSQVDASHKLIAWLCAKYNLNSNHIKGHKTINATNCPGNYDFQKLFTYLAQGGRTMTPEMQKEMDDCWDSTYNLFVGGTSPRKGTGIYAAWLSAWTKGPQFGPPLTNEYLTNDFNGATITAQEFAHARCEWRNGNAHWYTPQGEVIF